MSDNEWHEECSWVEKQQAHASLLQGRGEGACWAEEGCQTMKQQSAEKALMTAPTGVGSETIRLATEAARRDE